MKYFYSYSACMAGTDVYGTMEADTEQEVYDAVECEAYDHLCDMGVEDDIEPETDLYVEEYVAEVHDDLLN